MNLEILSIFRGVKGIETKNWICLRYEVWEAERTKCYVRRKHKKRKRR